MTKRGMGATAWLVAMCVACGGGGVKGGDDGGPPGGADAGPADAMDVTEPDGGVDEPSGPQVPAWVITATVGSLFLYSSMSDEELEAALVERRDEYVSVVEIDTRLSYYLTDAEFAAEAAFLDKAAKKAHELGMRAVIFYPSLEVLTTDGETLPSSMYKDHPDWVQVSIDGTPNVFYGDLEHWVDPGTESAWMSPNSGYRDYYLDRIRALAATALDGVWVDVPAYMQTGAAWAGAEPPAAADFRAWSIANGEGGAQGYAVPTEVDFDDPAFRAWVRWRHENLAGFLEDVRLAALDVNPEFMVIIETFPVDNVDATAAGLDGAYRVNAENYIRVWEIDSVSNTRAMQWANYEDFNSKIAMNKWARAMERDNPAWVFSYGYQPLDAGLVMAAAVASGVAPFEAQTPDMTLSVDSAFRTRWFRFVREHADALLGTERHADVAVWYSSPTRDFLDYPVGGEWGMYINTENPGNVPDWWADHPDDSALRKPHLGGWRGAAHALIQLGVPFRVVSEPGNYAAVLSRVQVVWLPSVAAMSDQAAEALRGFVAAGGVLIATGWAPAILDQTGAPRASSALADVFGFASGQEPGSRMQPFGDGLAIYRPDLRGTAMYAIAGDASEAATNLSGIEQLLRIHAPEALRFDTGPGVHVEVARPADDRHYLYVVNYTGLQLPATANPIALAVDYRPPAGFGVTGATAATPDEAGASGPLEVHPLGGGLYRLELVVDQFALITLEVAPVSSAPLTPYTGPSFARSDWKEAVDSAVAFLVGKMRNSELPEPNQYGIFTNLIDDESITEVYAHGHHVTAEHMGLLLRVAACLGDEALYRQAFRYVSEVMQTPGYGLINWAIDSKAQRPFLEESWYGDNWLSANAPLDDLRAIRGLLAGPRQVGVPEAADVADVALRGLYWTTVTDRHRGSAKFLDYPGGLLGFAFDWYEVDDPTLSPPAQATGVGYLYDGLIPVDYQDLYTIALAADRDPRWQSVLESATDLLLDAEMGQTGLFYNGYHPGGPFTGDFEYQGYPQGEHLKTIQLLWTALHLVRASTLDRLDATRRAAARAAAERAFAFFRGFYDQHGRVPEYFTMAGDDVPDCGPGAPDNCLPRSWANLFYGEVRIYALLARLALWLDDPEFATALIDQEILPDRVDDPGDPRYGLIGVSTTAEGDAEAWNILESLLAICRAAGGE